LLIDSLTQN